jgi:hypothetical protein
MMRYCSKCQGGVMEGETQTIPKQIPLPILHALAIPVENFLPYIMKKYHNYTVYICTTRSAYCEDSVVVVVAVFTDSVGVMSCDG